MKLKGSKSTEANNTSYLRIFINMFSHRKPNEPSKSVGPESPARAEFHKVFLCFDENGDGKISPSELQNCVRTFGHQLSDEDAEEVVGSSDSDGDGMLGFEDFVKLVEVQGEEERRRNLEDAFRFYVTGNGQDCITPRSLRRALRQLGGDSKSIDECEAMVRRFDLDGDGVLSFEEFRVMML